MVFGIRDLAKPFKKVEDVLAGTMEDLACKLVDKLKDLADCLIDNMGEFVDGVQILGCPSRPPLADESCRGLPQTLRQIDLGP